MFRFEHCNAKTCTEELLSLGNHNMKMHYLFEWLSTHDELRYGTQAEMIKLYIDNELVGYSLFESFEARTDKTTQHQGITYQDLGVIHFVTFPQHRKKGIATQLADELVRKIIMPLLARHQDVHAFVIATGRAAPIMARTKIPECHLLQDFYSEASFQEKVADYFNTLTNF